MTFSTSTIGYLYTRGDNPPDVADLMALVGGFLLEIRRSVGNENTKLDNIEMMEWMLMEAMEYRQQIA